MSVKPNLTHYPKIKLRSSFVFKANTFTCKTKTQFIFPFASLHNDRLRRSCKKSFEVRKLKTSCKFRVSENEAHDNVDSGFSKAFAKWFVFVQSVSPGGSWWNLSRDQENDSEAAKPMTALLALRRMWILISDERCIIFMALGSLVIAAVSMSILTL